MISNLLKGGKRRNLYYRNTRAEFQNLEPAEPGACGEATQAIFPPLLIQLWVQLGLEVAKKRALLACLVCYILGIIISTYNAFSMEEVA